MYTLYSNVLYRYNLYIGKIQICVFYHNIPTLRGAGEKTKNFISPVFLYYLVKMLGHFFPRFFPRFFMFHRVKFKVKEKVKWSYTFLLLLH